MLGKVARKRNRLQFRHVVSDVGKSRTVGAALVAASMMLSGCGTSGEGSTAPSTSSVAEPSNNPWDLPLEQRPALFDPCAEIPIEAVEQGLGGPVEPVEEFVSHKPGELLSCGWETEATDISILSTWKGRSDYIADRTITVEDNAIGDRPGMRGLDNIDDSGRSCIQLFFTERGTVWLMISLLSSFREFRGERFADACSALEQVIPPIMAHYPQGDFQ